MIFAIKFSPCIFIELSKSNTIIKYLNFIQQILLVNPFAPEIYIVASDENNCVLVLRNKTN